LPAPATLPQQQRIWALATLASEWEEVSEVVPGMNNLTLITKRPVIDLDTLSQRVRRAGPLGSTASEGRMVEIPVVYGGSAGPDLDNVAAHRPVQGSDRTPQRRRYVVYFLGFMPGFAYMGGLAPAGHAAPHHAAVSIPAGSVGIGGEQTGIYPMASPAAGNSSAAPPCNCSILPSNRRRCCVPATVYALPWSGGS
jgi:KipI family sensor histidine kinase inhibitor